MELLEIPVNNLAPGMFIAELDRPWLDTPFALQGFMVRDAEDIGLVARFCDTVYVDPDYRGEAVYPALTPGAEPPPAKTAQTRTARPVKRKVDRRPLTIKAELPQARESYESATEVIERTFQHLSRRRKMDIAAVREAIDPLIDSVFRNSEALAALVRMRRKGNYLYEHGLSVAVLAAVLGRQIGLDRDQLRVLCFGAALVDIGMTDLPDEWLHRPGPLSVGELTELHEHPKRGAAMLKKEGVDRAVIEIVAFHHERQDGSGYPARLCGERIPLLARLVSVVDAYDAMISARPFARARSSFEAVQELADRKDVHFDAGMVEQFIQAIGLFPTGATVELNNGEVGIVARQNPTRRLRPVLVLLLDASKQPLNEPLTIDLAKHGVDTEAGGALWVVRELEPGAYDINAAEHFL